MSRLKISVTRKIPDTALAALRKDFEVSVWEEETAPTYNQLKEFCRDSNAILPMLSDTISADIIKSNPNLKVIANFAVGYNNIDLKAAKARGVRIGNTPDVLTDATADLTICLLLMAARHARAAIQNVDNGEWKNWEPMGFLGKSLRGKTLGVFGFGRIGQAVARIASKAWDMRVLACTRGNSTVELDYPFESRELSTLITESDFLTVHAPLTTETEGLFNAQAFSGMKPGSIFINTARGEIHDNDALHSALTDGPLFAAAADVNNPEPISQSHPLLQLPNFILLPHIGSATEDARSRMAGIAAENIKCALQRSAMPAEIKL